MSFWAPVDSWAYLGRFWGRGQSCTAPQPPGPACRHVGMDFDDGVNQLTVVIAPEVTGDCLRCGIAINTDDETVWARFLTLDIAPATRT